MKVEVLRGDITKLVVDALVNAANAELRGGGGVDGAIHRAAGPELLEACRRLGGCPTGSARLTPGYGLAARFVIHAVGPVYKDGRCGEAEALRDAYRSASSLIKEHRLKSVAFAALSTGVYGYPIEEACAIAVRSVCEALRDAPVRVIFSAFGDEVEVGLRKALERYERARGPTRDPSVT